MPMIKLDARTGTVNVNDYEMQIRLTHNEFKTRYPSPTPLHETVDLGGVRYFSYRFPPVLLGSEKSDFSIVYVNQRIHGIGFGPVLPQNFDPDNEADQAGWREIELRWLYAARTLLRAAFGEPNSISLAYDEDENEHPPEYRKELQCWGYTFRWGGAGLSYHDVEGHSLWIRYNLFEQIRNWDELSEECERRISLEKQRQGPYHYTDNLIATQEVISLIRQHFDYQSVRPTLYYMGLVFDLPQWHTRLVLQVRPEREAKKAMYEVSRHDTARKIYTSDDQVLIDSLRLYMQSEKL
jgi:hypothetical protein